MKTSPALTLQLWLRVQPRIPRWPFLVVSNEHIPLPMELELRWVFLIAILKGDLWRTGDTKIWMRGEWICMTFHDQNSLCLQVSSVRYSRWNVGEAWCSLRGPWNSTMQPLDTFSNYRIYWVLQALRNGLKWVALMSTVGGNTYCAESMKGRFTISRDNPKTQFHLPANE
jgi:hypothetical protein